MDDLNFRFSTIPIEAERLEKLRTLPGPSRRRPSGLATNRQPQPTRPQRCLRTRQIVGVRLLKHPLCVPR